LEFIGLCGIQLLQGVFPGREKGIEDQEKNSGCENIHPYRIQVTRALTFVIRQRQPARMKEEQTDRSEKFTVVMGEVIEKMQQQFPHAFPGFLVFLPT
jgi:hypothetical protein